MELLKAIETADVLCPNPYSLEEKLRWCGEVSAGIRREAKKIYDVIETEVNASGDIIIPDDIAFEDIEAAYINGRYLSKLDFRSFAAGGLNKSPLPGGKLKLIYLTRAEPVRNILIKGKFDISEGFIRMENPPFKEGDCIQAAELSDLDDEPDFEKAKKLAVLENIYDGIFVDGGELEPQTEAVLAIRRVIDDLTEADEAPYDGMYIEYMLAKMALYQRDYTAYNAHITQYNFLMEELKREYKTRSPLNPLSSFKNYWNL